MAESSPDSTVKETKTGVGWSQFVFRTGGWSDSGSSGAGGYYNLTGRFGGNYKLSGSSGNSGCPATSGWSSSGSNVSSLSSWNTNSADSSTSSGYDRYGSRSLPALGQRGFSFPPRQQGGGDHRPDGRPEQQRKPPQPGQPQLAGA